MLSIETWWKFPLTLRLKYWESINLWARKLMMRTWSADHGTWEKVLGSNSQFRYVYNTEEEIGRVGIYAYGIELGGQTCIYINRLTVYRN